MRGSRPMRKRYCQKVGAGVCGHKRDDNPAEDPAGSMHGLRISVCFDAHVHTPRHHSVQRELREMRNDGQERLRGSRQACARKIHYASTEDETYPKHSEELTPADIERTVTLPSSSQSPIPRPFGL